MNLRVFPIFLIVLLASAMLLAVVPVKADNTNLGTIPSAWQVGQEGSVLDSAVLSPSGKASIRFGDGVTPRGSSTNEVNTGWIHVQPGDIVRFVVWVKSEAVGVVSAGMLGIGCDLYGPYERLWAVYDMPNFDTEMWKMPSWVDGDRSNEVNFVANGVNSWVRQEWSFTVPSFTFTKDDWNTVLDYGPQQAAGFIAWLTPAFDGDTNPTWFGDAEIYINPSDVPTPTPTPTPTPSSSPSPTATPSPSASPTEQPSNPPPYTDSGVLVLFGCGLMVLLYSNGDKKRGRRR